MARETSLAQTAKALTQLNGQGVAVSSSPAHPHGLSGLMWEGIPAICEGLCVSSHHNAARRNKIFLSTAEDT